MKHVWYIIITVCSLIACRRPNKEIKERIANSDSMAINYFKGDGTMDTVIAVKIIRDKQAIEQMATLIAERPIVKSSQCKGYDGSIHFFKMNQVVQDIDFRMEADDCMYFSFLQFGKLQTTALPGEAKNLISSYKK